MRFTIKCSSGIKPQSKIIKIEEYDVGKFACEIDDIDQLIDLAYESEIIMSVNAITETMTIEIYDDYRE